MSEYILSNGNGRYIKHNEFSGKFSETSNQTLATTYPTYAKAKNVLKSCIGKRLKAMYHVEEILDGSIQDAKVALSDEPEFSGDLHIDKIKELANEPVAEDYTEEIEVTLAAFADFIDTKRAELDKLSEEHSKVEREIIDIQHYIEFRDLNAYQGYLLCKLLKQRLKKRRALKNSIQAIGYLEVGNVDTGAVKHAASCVGGLAGRKYSPRELKEIFE